MLSLVTSLRTYWRAQPLRMKAMMAFFMLMALACIAITLLTMLANLVHY
jgi:hypothetical protein